MQRIQCISKAVYKCGIEFTNPRVSYLNNNLTHINSLSTAISPEIVGAHRKEHKKDKYSKHSDFISNSAVKSDGNFGFSTPTHHQKSNETEQEFLVRAKNDPDDFGTKYSIEKLEDEGDIQEEKHFTEQPNPRKKLSTKQYADIIKSFVQQRKIKEAIDVLEVRMLKEDRVKPENYIYNLLLGACGRVGYTKKAFMLYNDMKKRGLKVTGGTYTALFNACANSPWKTDGLSRAKHLYDIMIEKGDQPNDTNYNAMIKAFGRCGDLPMTFFFVDDMAKKGFVIKDDTINFLLQACITDKEAGFRHSLLVWRKMIEHKISPSIHTFNLLLRCVRDCGLGDLEVTKDVIDKLLKDSEKAKLVSDPKTLLLEHNIRSEVNDVYSKTNRSSDQLIMTENVPKDLSAKVIEDLRPDLLARVPHMGNVLSLSEVKSSEDRLLLLGGCKGFLQTMGQHKCIPDIKTFTELLLAIPSTLSAEKELFTAMKKLNIKPDVSFYNMLIKKRSLRLDYEGAKEIVSSMKNEKLRPDLITYGVLALSCKNQDEASELVQQMKATGYTLNSAILGAMLKQGCFHMNFGYIFEIMELCLKESVPVNKKFLEHLEGFKEMCRSKLDAKTLTDKQKAKFNIFKARHKTWLTEVQIDDSEDAHPWQQYRQYSPTDFKFKPKDTARFKARHTSSFKVKTSTKIRY